jgi:hypothetical protein
MTRFSTKRRGVFDTADYMASWATRGAVSLLVIGFVLQFIGTWLGGRIP